MKKRIMALMLGGLLAVFLCACSGGDAPATDQQESSEQQTEAAEPQEDVPTEYRNALQSAENYSNIMHMSKKAIYDQLTAEYGDQFPAEAAQYAVDNLQADYKANALASGKNYYESMGMSKEAVRDQLVSEYGDQFTQEEADYAVENLE